MTRTTLTAILALSAALVAAPALASTERGPGRAMMPMFEMDFAAIDADGSGAITLEEWRAHLTERMETRRAEMIEARVSALMEADADGDGQLTPEELTAHFEAQIEARQAERMARAEEGEGRRWNRNRAQGMRGHGMRGHGMRGQGMRGQGMRGQGWAMDADQRIVRSFQQIDRDGDGQITEAEFDRFVEAIQARSERRAERRTERMERRQQRRGGAD